MVQFSVYFASGNCRNRTGHSVNCGVATAVIFSHVPLSSRSYGFSSQLSTTAANFPYQFPFGAVCGNQLQFVWDEKLHPWP